jgi:predicted nucleotidyltransferase
VRAIVTDEEVLDMMIDRSIRRFRPLRVIVFGSRTRGSAGPGNEIDPFVALRDASERYALANHFGLGLFAIEE